MATDSRNSASGPIRATWTCLGIAWALFLIPIPGLGIFVGVPLCVVTFVLSIVVMANGRTADGLIPMLLILMASPFVWFLGMGLFSMIFMKGMGALDGAKFPS